MHFIVVNSIDCSLIFFSAAWGYLFLGTAFAIIPQDYQWILGLMLPIVRQWNVWCLQAVSKKASGGEVESNNLKIACSHFMETRHAIFVSIMMGNTTNATVYSIIGIDFALNIYHGMKIMRTKINAVTPEENQKLEGKVEKHSYSSLFTKT